MSSTLVLAILFGALAGALASFAFTSLRTPSQEELIRDFYRVETASSVSPHHIRKAISKSYQDFVLVDLRSSEEYETEHVVGAYSVPAYKDPNTSAYGDVERIVKSFRELEAENPEKDLIVYCYSIPCMTGRKIGNLLAEHGVYVKHLNVGWNEWRYHWELWNHPHEWAVTNVTDYVAVGKEPGEFLGEKDSGDTCLPGEFGC